MYRCACICEFKRWYCMSLRKNRRIYLWFHIHEPTLWPWHGFKEENKLIRYNNTCCAWPMYLSSLWCDSICNLNWNEFTCISYTSIHSLLTKRCNLHCTRLSIITETSRYYNTITKNSRISFASYCII